MSNHGCPAAILPLLALGLMCVLEMAIFIFMTALP